MDAPRICPPFGKVGSEDMNWWGSGVRLALAASHPFVSERCCLTLEVHSEEGSRGLFVGELVALEVKA